MFYQYAGYVVTPKSKTQVLRHRQTIVTSHKGVDFVLDIIKTFFFGQKDIIKTFLVE